MNIPEPIRDLFNGQPEKIHFCFVNYQKEYARATRTWRYSFLITLLVHAAFFAIFYLIKVPEMAIFNIFSMLIFIGVIFLLRYGFFYTATNLAGLEVAIHALCASYFVGWNSGYNYFLFSIPICMFLIPMTKHPLDVFIKAFWYIGSTGAFFIGWNYLHDAKPVYQQSIEILTLLQVSNLLMFSFGMSLIALTFGIFIRKAENALQQEQKKVERAYSLLSKYVAPQLADKISEGQIDLIWKHNRRKLSLFFSDIRDFTSITDSMEPEDMAGILNEYLTEMNIIINEYRGTLAQVIGDGLYVFFGAPESSNDRDHAVRCVKMAVDMQQKIRDLNKRWFDRGVDEVLQIRCGINTGMATVGGYGSSERKEYTAMGMQVNIAARIEQACKPGSVLISHTTWALVKDEISCSEQKHISVKGVQRPLRVYSVDAVV